MGTLTAFSWGLLIPPRASPARVSWWLGLPGYCGANCWRSDVIGYNKISHTHTLINIPSHHSHTHTGSNPAFSCEMECDPLHIFTLFILISCFIPHILHSTWYSNYFDTPLLCNLARGQSTLAPIQWYNNGTSWQWTLAGVMVQLMFSCVYSFHHALSPLLWKMWRVNLVMYRRLLCGVVWSLVVVRAGKYKLCLYRKSSF